MTESTTLQRVCTRTLGMAGEESGPVEGVPVMLLHGFP